MRVVDEDTARRDAALTSHTFCSACFTQDHTKRHIDFDAACDRGFGQAGEVKISMDNLILCEECIARAGLLVDLHPDGVMPSRISELEAKLEESERERVVAQNYADRLEDAFEKRPIPVKVDHRRKPRSKKTAPSED